MSPKNLEDISSYEGEEKQAAKDKVKKKKLPSLRYKKDKELSPPVR